MNLRISLLAFCFAPLLAAATPDQPALTTIASSDNKEEQPAVTQQLPEQTPVGGTVLTFEALKPDLIEGAKIAAKYTAMYALIGTLLQGTAGLTVEFCERLVAFNNGLTLETTPLGKTGRWAWEGCKDYTLYYAPYAILVALVSRIEKENKLTTKDISGPIVIGLSVSVLSKMLGISQYSPVSISACVTLAYLAYKRSYEKKDDLKEQKKSLEKTLALLKARQNNATKKA